MKTFEDGVKHAWDIVGEYAAWLAKTKKQYTEDSDDYKRLHAQHMAMLYTQMAIKRGHL